MTILGKCEYTINNQEVAFWYELGTWHLTFKDVQGEYHFTGNSLRETTIQLGNARGDILQDHDFNERLIQQLSCYVDNPQGLDLEFSGVLLIQKDSPSSGCTYSVWQTVDGTYIATTTNKSGRFDWDNWPHVDAARALNAIREWFGTDATAKDMYRQLGISTSIKLR